MGWTLDHTGPQMILTIKLSALAYDYFDGTVDKVRAGIAGRGAARELPPFAGRSPAGPRR